jgi:hypothetical protein
MSRPQFISGVELNARFYDDVVEPLVRPWPHAAALLGWGSDVLGVDTVRSTDHGWGPRMQIFVADADVSAARAAVDAGLPESFGDWPIRYGWDGLPVEHRVETVTLGTWLDGQLGVDPRAGLGPVDWLLLPQQRILGVVRGAVYADPRGELATLRTDLRWYPRDVWLWLLASCWHRVAQEEAFVGRAAEVGDELGSRLIAARLVRDLIRLCLLMEREYCPYSKWLGTAFRQLRVYPDLAPSLDRVLSADRYEAREQALADAYELVARKHNERGVTDAVEPEVRQFHERPFRVLSADRFADACLARVADPTLRGLPLVGSVDQFADSSDVLSDPRRARRLDAIYR